MTSRVKNKLCLKSNGKHVEVRGPIVNWDSDEVSAVFSVVIAQMGPNGLVTANGSSTGVFTNPASKHWSATAVVTDPSLHLEVGPATAYATATIEVQGPGYGTYTWTLLTRLVHCK